MWYFQAIHVRLETPSMIYSPGIPRMNVDVWCMLKYAVSHCSSQGRSHWGTVWGHNPPNFYVDPQLFGSVHTVGMSVIRSPSHWTHNSSQLDHGTPQPPMSGCALGSREGLTLVQYIKLSHDALTSYSVGPHRFINTVLSSFEQVIVKKPKYSQ